MSAKQIVIGETQYAVRETAKSAIVFSRPCGSDDNWEYLGLFQSAQEAWISLGRVAGWIVD